MANTYVIRFEAVKEHLLNDGDLLRYEREVSRLSIDIISAIRRCANIDDPCLDLVELQEILDDEMYQLRERRT